ncbi:DEAD/DEAH box helicase [Chryseobacterium gregarium]|uniref:DEAD/DEAH box helicase n=1 Tax=Chryseobacterium gregarium TaxID=456299 RepID=UPI0003FAEEB3|nr:DEAD/DEAH box helicase [Chryseobacterium gregarium]
MLFTDLNIIKPILDALQKQGYEKPTPIQEQSIPSILEHRDVLGTAQTGTGKTAAFAIPILQNLMERKGPKSNHIKALILTPTRELAIQIEESFNAYGKNLPLKKLVVFGGVKQGSQETALRKGVDILVATPGRLLDFIAQGIISLKNLEIFVLDEADRMLDMGFVHDVKRIIKLLPKRQTLFFSATMPTEIQKLADSILNNPIKVSVTPISSTAETIKQAVYFVDKENKLDLLTHILQNDISDSVLVFSRTKHGADKIARKLQSSNISAEAIHGNKSQNARQNALNNFKSGRTRILVATDIAARGIDIDELKYVVNYELSDVAETYVHRIGRTGRAGAEGSSISFVDGLDLLNLKDTEKLIGMKIPVEKNHPFHTENLVVEKRDSNNKPFTPRPKPAGQQKSDHSKKPKNKSSFFRKK